MNFGVADSPCDEQCWDKSEQDRPVLNQNMFRSAFARALHFRDEPRLEEDHKADLRHLEKALNTVACQDTPEELKEQLDGQVALVTRLKGNLKDNRSKLRATLRDLKASRKKLAPLQEHIQAQRKELFENSMVIDSQRVEINHLRSELETNTQLKHKFSVAHATLARLSQDNQRLKDEILDLRIRNRELEASGPTGEDILKSLNSEIAELKAAKTEYQSEIDFLKSENKAAQDRQTSLMGELIELRKSAPVETASGPIDTGQIRQLNDKLQAALEREALLEKRLDILTRDLDIVHQTNDMLRGRISKMETLQAQIDMPKQAVGF